MQLTLSKINKFFHLNDELVLKGIKETAIKYIFLEEIDTREYNMGSWVINFNQPRWVYPLAIWHNEQHPKAFFLSVPK